MSKLSLKKAATDAELFLLCIHRCQMKNVQALLRFLARDFALTSLCMFV